MQKSKARTVLSDILSGITQTIAGKAATIALAAIVAAAGTGVVIHHVSAQKTPSQSQSVPAQTESHVNNNTGRVSSGKAVETSSYSSQNVKNAESKSSQAGVLSKSANQGSSSSVAMNSSSSQKASPNSSSIAAASSGLSH